ncbi:MAG: gamma-glutamyl-gamma-aminobutyrate hydrolase family protein [Chloroflexi bacterium]|nr:gamma-glutamyl-gamma-aminobutyrate hydrolase family protein [Chloroflexota bacterium]
MTKPRIGFTSREAGRETFLAWQRDYWFCIELAGGEPISLSPAATADIETRLDRIDGLLLTGGGDLHPRLYGQPINGAATESIRTDRDEMELALTAAAMERGMPILGVCRGIQVLNVALGGTLTQDWEGHTGKENSFDAPKPHAVSIRERSLLDQVLACGSTVTVNSYHHQAICDHDLASQLIATGISADGVIEAVEHVVQPWLLGVQWHPERLYELGPEHRRLFVEFVKAARGYQLEDDPSHHP